MQNFIEIFTDKTLLTQEAFFTKLSEITDSLGINFTNETMNFIKDFLKSNYTQQKDKISLFKELIEGHANLTPKEFREGYKCPRCGLNVWCDKRYFNKGTPCIYCLKKNFEFLVNFTPITFVNTPSFIPVSKQEHGTCFAHATAYILLFTESQIYGRKLQDYNQLVEEIISKFTLFWDKNGNPSGGDADGALEKYCEQKSLSYNIVKQEGVSKALSQNRPVIATFFLNSNQWKIFKDPSSEIISKSAITEADDENMISEGHSVVIVGETKEYYLIRNSWGDKYADQGFCRVQKDAIFWIFYDVFFKVDLLTQEDKDNWANATSEEKQKFKDQVSSKYKQKQYVDYGYYYKDKNGNQNDRPVPDEMD